MIQIAGVPAVFCQRSSALPSALKSPTPLTTHDESGLMSTFAPWMSVVSDINQIETGPLSLCPHHVRLSVAVEIAGAPGMPSCSRISAGPPAAGADDFIEELPQRYETMLEEGAVNLSGGQKQRLSIARALLRRPRIIIFDEATSALDPESEAVVIRNLGRIAKGRTTIVISHRLQTIRDADMIIVMDEGKVVDSGTHSDLLGRNFIYRHLWTQQIGRPV